MPQQRPLSDYIPLCVDTAVQILNLYPDAKIYTLGQSPAWIGRCIEFIELIINKQKKAINYIPFSGKFYKRDKQDLSGLIHLPEGSYSIYHSNSKHRPKYEDQYRTILTQLDLNPQAIYDVWFNKKKIVLLEYVRTGESLASFLSVLYLWAEELGQLYLDALQENLQVVLLKAPDNKLEIIELAKTNFHILCDSIYTDADMLKALANGNDIGPESNRLVPLYPEYAWEHPPKPVDENTQEIINLTNLLKKYIKQLPSEQFKKPKNSLALSKSTSLSSYHRFPETLFKRVASVSKESGEKLDDFPYNDKYRCTIL